MLQGIPGPRGLPGEDGARGRPGEKVRLIEGKPRIILLLFIVLVVGT